jgi:uncharacterized protein
MHKGIWSEISPITQLLAVFLLILTSFIIVSAIGVLFAIPFVGIEGINGLLTTSGSVATLKYLQLVQTFGLFIVPSFAAAWLFSNNPLGWLCFKKTHLKTTILAIILIVAAQPLSAWLAQMNHGIVFPESLRYMENWMKTTEESANGVIFPIPGHKKHLVYFNECTDNCGIGFNW